MVETLKCTNQKIINYRVMNVAIPASLGREVKAFAKLKSKTIVGEDSVQKVFGIVDLKMPVDDYMKKMRGKVKSNP